MPRGRRSVAAIALVLAAVGAMLSAAVPPATAATTTTSPAGPAPLPTPRPATVDAGGTVSAFPGPGTLTASPSTVIALRGAPAALLTTMTVTGSASGPHPGTFHPSPDGSGTTFVPDAPFHAGERVTVTTGLALRGAHDGTYSFAVATPAPFPATPLTNPPGAKPLPADDFFHFVSRADLTPPKLDVVTNRAGQAPGDTFVTPVGVGAQAGLDIYDPSGQPVWVSPATGGRVLDLQPQTYEGRPVLTWYQGSVVSPGIGQGAYVIADTDYHVIARVHALDGYAGDLHDFQITPQGTALFMIYNPVVVDARSVGGSRHERVLEAVVQEVDIATGELRFEWHSIGAIGLRESYQPVPKHATEAYDYIHPNSVALDDQGNVLLSARHTWTVYDIDRTSGALAWRLGGKFDNFTEDAAARTAWQHDARMNPDGSLAIFDNGASSVSTQHPTRGIVLDLDRNSMTATLRRAYRPPQKLSSESQGSFRLLTDGDYFTGWGSRPELTEFAPDGTVLYDARFPAARNNPVSSYRAIRAVWSGEPTDAPAVAVRRTNGHTMVYASWNGDTRTTQWVVLAGSDLTHLAPVTTAPRNGFETTVPVTNNDPYFAVRAVATNGATLGTSAVTTPIV